MEDLGETQQLLYSHFVLVKDRGPSVARLYMRDHVPRLIRTYFSIGVEVLGVLNADRRGDRSADGSDVHFVVAVNNQDRMMVRHCGG